MILPPLLLALTLILPAPVEVPLVRPSGEWGSGPGWARFGLGLPASTERGEIRMLLAPDVPRTVVFSREGARDERSGLVRIGSFPIEVREGERDGADPEEFDGLIGADFLATHAVGLDPASGTARVWGKGTDPAEIARWAGPAAESAPLATLDDGRPSASVELAGGPVRLLLAPAGSAALLDAGAAPADAWSLGTLPGAPSLAVRARTGATAPGRTLRWLIWTDDPAERPPGVSGTLPFTEGTRGRFVLDVPNRRTLSTPAGAEGRMGEELGRLLRLPVRVRDGRAFAAGRGSYSADSSSRFEGREVVLLGEYLVTAMLRSWTEGEDRLVLETLYGMRRDGVRVGVRERDGENDVITWDVPGEAPGGSTEGARGGSRDRGPAVAGLPRSAMTTASRSRTLRADDRLRKSYGPQP